MSIRRIIIVLLAVGLGVAATLCRAQTKPQPGAERPIAIVAAQAIYEQDLSAAIGPNLLDLRKQEYKLKSDALNQVVRKKLVEVEARKKGISSDELMRQEVDSKIPEPSDDEAKGYYLAVKNQTTLPFEQIKSQVKQLLRGAEVEQAREKYADSLRDKTEVAIFLHPPMVQVAYDSARLKGNPDASITIVEFADFQCPFCSQVQPILNEVLATYKDKVKLAYQDFPLSQIHQHAEAAAGASRCALAQGKYWQMHDAMFADQSKLDEAALVKTAESLGMDQKSFESCLQSGKYKQAVEQDVQAGSRAGVNATPTFIINGEFLSGIKSVTDLTAVIDRQLSTLASKSSTLASR